MYDKNGRQITEWRALIRFAFRPRKDSRFIGLAASVANQVKPVIAVDARYGLRSPWRGVGEYVYQVVTQRIIPAITNCPCMHSPKRLTVPLRRRCQVPSVFDGKHWGISERYCKIPCRWWWSRPLRQEIDPDRFLKYG